MKKITIGTRGSDLALWQAHFVKNMFIRPSEQDLENFEPDFVVFNSSKTSNKKWKEKG